MVYFERALASHAGSEPSARALKRLAALTDLKAQGGELYVLDGSAGADWRKTAVAFGSVGDVAVFRSNGAFFHGMNKVRRVRAASAAGAAPTRPGPQCRRIAVGLLHKLQQGK